MGFENTARLKAKLAKLQQPNDFIMNALESAGLSIRNVAVVEIQSAASGESYVRYAPKRHGTASSPGDPPHTDSGNLVNQIQVQRFANYVDVGIIGDGALYGKWLEYGTNRIIARPWLAPALQASIATINMKLQAAGTEWIAEIIKG